MGVAQDVLGMSSTGPLQSSSLPLHVSTPLALASELPVQDLERRPSGRGAGEGSGSGLHATDAGARRRRAGAGRAGEPVEGILSGGVVSARPGEKSSV